MKRDYIDYGSDEVIKYVTDGILVNVVDRF